MLEFPYGTDSLPQSTYELEDSKQMEDKSMWDLENCSERCPSWSVKDAGICVKCAGESMMNEFILCGFRLNHPNHRNPHGKPVHTKHVLLQKQRGRSLYTIYCTMIYLYLYLLRPKRTSSTRSLGIACIHCERVNQEKCWSRAFTISRDSVKNQGVTG